MHSGARTIVSRLLVTGLASALLAVGLTPASASAAPLPLGQYCSPEGGVIIVVGARGSGEKVVDRNLGVGETVKKVYDLIRQSPSLKKTQVKLHALDYPAAPVSDLFLGSIGYAKYMASVAAGYTALNEAAQSFRANSICTDRWTLSLAGYSQGAMAIHRFVSLAGEETLYNSRIFSSVLVGDGDRTREDPVLRFGTAWAKGAGKGVAQYIPTASGLPGPLPPLPATQIEGYQSASVCTYLDPVCDLQPTANPLTLTDQGNKGVRTHTSYDTSPLLRQAVKAIFG